MSSPKASGVMPSKWTSRPRWLEKAAARSGQVTDADCARGGGGVREQAGDDLGHVQVRAPGDRERRRERVAQHALLTRGGQDDRQKKVLQVEAWGDHGRGDAAAGHAVDERHDGAVRGRLQR